MPTVSAIRAEYVFRNGQWRLITGVVDEYVPPSDEPVPPVWVGAGADRRATSGTVSVPWPDGHQAGDLGLLICETSNQSVSPPAGWERAPGMMIGAGTAGANGSVGLEVHWKRATSAAEPAVSVPNPGNHILARICCWRGVVATGSPFDVSATQIIDPATTAITVPSATTTQPQCLAVLLVTQGTDHDSEQFPAGLTNANLTSLTRRATSNTLLGTGGGIMVNDGVMVAAGATGTSTGTLANAGKQANVIFALIPGETGTPSVSVADFVSAGDTQGGINGAAPSFPWGAGHDAGDIGLLVLVHANQSPATPSGWTLAPGMPIGTGTAGATGSVGLTVFWKRAASAAEANVSITVSGSYLFGRILVWRGGPTAGDPFTAAGAGTNIVGTATTAVAGGSGTTDGPERLVLTIATDAIDSLTAQFAGWDQPGSDLQFVAGSQNVNTTLGVGGGFSVQPGRKQTAGAYAALTNTLLTASKQANASLIMLPGPITPPSGVIMTNLRSFIGLGSLEPDSRWGNAPYPDNYRGGYASGAGSRLTSAINNARARGGATIERICGDNTALMDANGYFSPATYIARYKLIIDALGTAGLVNARLGVQDGSLRGFWTLDDFVNGGGANGFTAAVTFEELEGICRFHKTGESVFPGVASDANYGLPWMPLLAYGPIANLKAMAAAGSAATDPPGYVRINGIRQYRFLDATFSGWSRKTRGPAGPWIATLVADSKACSLGWLGGMNYTQGTGVDNGGYGCQKFDSSLCSMSPDEYIEGATAILGSPYSHGFHTWWFKGPGTAYWDSTPIHDAWVTINAMAAGRLAASLNQRGDLVAA